LTAYDPIQDIECGQAVGPILHWATVRLWPIRAWPAACLINRRLALSNMSA